MIKKTDLLAAASAIVGDELGVAPAPSLTTQLFGDNARALDQANV